jgi:release factor glutamine methyltransferase
MALILTTDIRGALQDREVIVAAGLVVLPAVNHAKLTELLTAEGFVAASDEALELIAAARGDRERLTAMVERRRTGEPLAWITGSVTFAGLTLRVAPDVYVPREQSEALAERAVRRLPERGVAVDVCTGCGAIARALMHRRPGASVVAFDLDEDAVACARSNAVDAHVGDLFAPLPAALRAFVDVVAGVVPYVPTAELGLLQRDTLRFESPLAYDGGPDGTDILRRVVMESTAVLRPGGALLLELGGDEAELLAEDLERVGYRDVLAFTDEDGDVRGIEATLGG